MKYNDKIKQKPKKAENDYFVKSKNILFFFVSFRGWQAQQILIIVMFDKEQSRVFFFNCIFIMRCLTHSLNLTNRRKKQFIEIKLTAAAASRYIYIDTHTSGKIRALPRTVFYKNCKSFDYKDQTCQND